MLSKKFLSPHRFSAIGGTVKDKSPHRLSAIGGDGIFMKFFLNQSRVWGGSNV